MTAMAMECESGDEKNCLNKWTRIAIFTLVLIMATSVALAISFPYQGGDSYLRAAANANAAASDGGGKVDVVLEDAVLLEDVTVVVDSNSTSTVDASVEMSGVESSTVEKNNILPTVDAGANEKMSGDDGTTNNEENDLLPTEDDETTAEQVSPTTQTDNNVDAASTAKEEEHTTETIGGLFGPIVTAATDEQQSPNNAQANTTSTDSDNYSSSCQMELQQADSNLDNIIDALEYITFLHNVGSMSLSTIQFDDLPSEYQVTFDHLAKAHTDVTNDVGISIATMEELERVCVYISKKGSSAVHKFDWDQLSSLP